MKKSLITILILGAALAGFYAISAWNNPGSAPTAANPALLNIGPDGQSKAGTLTLGTGGPPNALIIDSGDVCFGGDCRNTWPGNSNLEIIAVHSQTSSTPSCPSGWDSVWTGYSFAGAALQRGVNGAQDLSSPGSCLEQFIPIPVLECLGDYEDPTYCDYYTDDDWGYWLSTTTSPTPLISGIAQNEPYISRCNVCKSTAKVITRHSFSSSILSANAL